MKVAALTSGGKDSLYALHRARQAGHDVAALVNLVPVRRDAWLFHAEALEVVPVQAEALDLPLVREEAGEGEDAEIAALREALAGLDVEGVVTGGRRSTYQRDRFGGVFEELGLAGVHPLWDVPAGEVLEAMVEDWEVRVAAVAADGLGEDWLMRRLDGDALRELFALAGEYGFRRDGEGGAFETVVLDGPGFAGRIEVDWTPTWDGQSGYIQVQGARIVHAREKR